jgi:hypothetical protein
MGIAATLDGIGRPAWLALTILGFIFWWPLGLVSLAFLIGSGRMGCWKHGRRGEWQGGGMERGMERMQRAMQRWGGGEPPSSGNRAFDEYRTETLRRLEQEQREFLDFLERLRLAKDKAEFDQFLASRRRDEGPAPQPQG